MIVVLSEQSTNISSINARETKAITEAARIFGCHVYTIPPNFDECETGENALAYVPEFHTRTPAVWVGFIPTVERYEAIYDAALRKNIQLVNSPQQHRTAMEFDHFYPLLHNLTPKSIIMEEIESLEQVPRELDFPVFVKGAVKSNKNEGWSAVVAHNMEELRSLATHVLQHSERSRGKVVVRELVKFKTIATDANGFPIGREYRAFLHKGELLAYGFYWDEYQDPNALSGDDKDVFTRILKETARCVDVPFMSIDIGQLENDEWTVIEIGDGQFSGLSQIPVLELWSKVKDFTL